MKSALDISPLDRKVETRFCSQELQHRPFVLVRHHSFTVTEFFSVLSLLFHQKVDAVGAVFLHSNTKKENGYARWLNG